MPWPVACWRSVRPLHLLQANERAQEVEETAMVKVGESTPPGRTPEVMPQGHAPGVIPPEDIPQGRALRAVFLRSYTRGHLHPRPYFCGRTPQSHTRKVMPQSHSQCPYLRSNRRSYTQGHVANIIPRHGWGSTLKSTATSTPLL